ncbi:hypothetical protein LIER_27242 [Lithospermum erythrorhizon]|uniref:Retroviral polymerase SH3-like domain-containing protein n=1 Tax=Lithospermum erythrorhizon TaxID=34254 RepID=A0AAV3REQ5_LITER
MRCLLFQACLPPVFWVQALHYIVFLINVLPSQQLKYKSPYEILHNKSPNLSHIKTFGCLCYPNIIKAPTPMFSPRALPCLFLGLSEAHKGFKCFNLENQRIIMSRDVTFQENIFPYTKFHTVFNVKSLLLFPPNFDFTSNPGEFCATKSTSSSTHPAVKSLLPSTIPFTLPPLLASTTHCVPTPFIAPAPPPITPPILSSTPTAPPILHPHSMQTRAKSGIHKPR